MQAIWNGHVLAESNETRDVGGYRYFPRSSVRMDLLIPVPRAGSDLECPHGVQFFDCVVAGQRSGRAAWSYEAPGESKLAIDHWIGFWKDVEIA